MAKMLSNVPWSGNMRSVVLHQYYEGWELNQLAKRYQKARKLFPKGKKRIPFRDFLPAYGFYGQRFGSWIMYPMNDKDMERIEMLQHPNWCTLVCIWAVRHRKKKPRRAA